jgi:hypothetical protein
MSGNLLDTFGLTGNTYTITQQMSHTTKLTVATLNMKVFRLELSMTHYARHCGWWWCPRPRSSSGAEIIHQCLQQILSWR